MSSQAPTDNRKQLQQRRETPPPPARKASLSQLENNALVLLTQSALPVNRFSDFIDTPFLALRREMPTFVGTGGKMTAEGKKSGHRLPTTAVFAYLYTLERQ